MTACCASAENAARANKATRSFDRTRFSLRQADEDTAGVVPAASLVHFRAALLHDTAPARRFRAQQGLERRGVSRPRAHAERRDAFRELRRAHDLHDGGLDAPA